MKSSLTISLRRARPLLGTMVDIRASGRASSLNEAVEAAFREVAFIHGKMSFHDARSDVSRLNREAVKKPTKVSAETWEVLSIARRMSEASGGVFDVTVAPRLVQWGYLPGHRSGEAWKRGTGYRSVEMLSGRRVKFLENTLIDLGGIAKGYAVDRACAALESRGIFNYVVNAGGDLRVGRAPEEVWVRHPGARGRFVRSCVLREQSMATSADYYSRRRWGRKMVSPIVHPGKGASAPWGGSVSVIADRCVISDSLTKIVLLSPSSLASRCLAQFKARGLRFSPGRGLWMTMGFDAQS